MKGMSKLYSLDEEDIRTIRQWDIIGLSETWLLTPPGYIPNISDYFNVVFVPATKDKQRGRGSGGLLMLINKKLSYEVMDTCKLWIFIKITDPSIDLVLGSVYINPTYNMVDALEKLQSYLEGIPLNKTIIGGDMNAWIGELNYLDIPDLHDSGFSAERHSLHTDTNNRGELLVEVMEISGFFTLSRRTAGDTPGQHTFISGGGYSVIDLVWCNWELAADVSRSKYQIPS
uniref:Endonuclease/exonuclease/phosphatase domain-containing protein n=1 Tax=Cacopsylla melanoneura TaxID=428564 RepID=A0A8D9AJD6_9HEMI